MSGKRIVLRYLLNGRENGARILKPLDDDEYVTLLRLLPKFKEMYGRGEVLINHRSADGSFVHIVVGIIMNEIHVIKITVLNTEIYVCIINFDLYDMISALRMMFGEGR